MQYAMLIMVGMMGILLPLVVVGQQVQPFPPDYQRLLERSMTREGTTQNLCTQQREDLIAYFQEELRKKDKLLQEQKPVPPAPTPGNEK